MVPENTCNSILPTRRGGSSLILHIAGFSVPGGFMVLPPSAGFSMIFLLGSPYPLEILVLPITNKTSVSHSFLKTDSHSWFIL